MGRLFWKFFCFIGLVQLAGILGVSAIFWFEHQRTDERRHLGGPPGAERHFEPPPREFGPGHPPPPGPDHPPPGSDHPSPGPGRAPQPPGRLPWIPLLSALFVSLACAVGLAWYFAKPIRQLRRAFDAAADGDLAVRIGHGMDGRRDELADLGRDFDRMTERLGRLVDGQKRLLHDVSHEMRSPLARLQAAIGLARQQPGRTEDTLERIEREGERLNQLIGELLTLSRLEAGVVGETEPVDVGELLDHIAKDARFEGAARRIAVDCAHGELPEVRTNAELLHRAVENIVRNALRHSPDGGVVRIEACRLGARLLLGVIDQGPGLPESELAAIFQPFYRGGGQSSGGGYGLGLAIAQRVVAAANGRIQAVNMPAGGLLVEIELPL